MRGGSRRLWFCRGEEKADTFGRGVVFHETIFKEGRPFFAFRPAALRDGRPEHRKKPEKPALFAVKRLLKPLYLTPAARYSIVILYMLKQYIIYK